MWVRWSTRQNFPREYRRYSLFRLHLNRSSIPLGFAGCVWSGWISDRRSTVWDLNCLRSWLSRSLFQSFALYRRLREHRFHPFLIGEGCCIWLRTSIYLFSPLLPSLPPLSLSLSLIVNVHARANHHRQNSPRHVCQTAVRCLCSVYVRMHAHR